MAIKKKNQVLEVAYKKKPKVKRKGVHAKTKQSAAKTSKLYKKLNIGQG